MHDDVMYILTTLQDEVLKCQAEKARLKEQVSELEACKKKDLDEYNEKIKWHTDKLMKCDKEKESLEKELHEVKAALEKANNNHEHIIDNVKAEKEKEKAAWEAELKKKDNELATLEGKLHTQENELHVVKAPQPPLFTAGPQQGAKVSCSCVCNVVLVVLLSLAIKHKKANPSVA